MKKPNKPKHGAYRMQFENTFKGLDFDLFILPKDGLRMAAFADALLIPDACSVIRWVRDNYGKQAEMMVLALLERED